MTNQKWNNLALASNRLLAQREKNQKRTSQGKRKETFNSQKYVGQMACQKKNIVKICALCWSRTVIVDETNALFRFCLSLAEYQRQATKCPRQQHICPSRSGNSTSTVANQAAKDSRRLTACSVTSGIQRRTGCATSREPVPASSAARNLNCIPRSWVAVSTMPIGRGPIPRSHQAGQSQPVSRSPNSNSWMVRKNGS